MLADLLAPWLLTFKAWILEVFKYIFPEYPLIGVAVVISALILFVYFLVRNGFLVALKMAATSLVMFAFLVFSLHWIIKLYHVML